MANRSMLKPSFLPPLWSQRCWLDSERGWRGGEHRLGYCGSGGNLKSTARGNIMAAVILACVLAAMLGFAAHRASICTVRAVAEVVSSRTAYMLARIVKSVLWVVAITLPIFLLMPSAGANLGGWPLTATAVVGGCVFGVGAAINGA